VSIDVAISGGRNVIKKTLRRFQNIIRHYNRNVECKNIPVIIWANRTSKSFRKYPSNIPKKHKIQEIHKTAILGTAQILQ
jgi:hypothetical protein